jgi:hypothetical protein
MPNQNHQCSNYCYTQIHPIGYRVPQREISRNGKSWKIPEVWITREVSKQVHFKPTFPGQDVAVDRVALKPIDPDSFYKGLNQAILNDKELPYRIRRHAMTRTSWTTEQLREVVGICQRARTYVKKHLRSHPPIQAHYSAEYSLSKVVDKLEQAMTPYTARHLDCLAKVEIQPQRWSYIKHGQRPIRVHELIQLVNLFMDTKLRNPLLDYLLVENRLLH